MQVIAVQWRHPGSVWKPVTMGHKPDYRYVGPWHANDRFQFERIVQVRAEILRDDLSACDVLFDIRPDEKWGPSVWWGFRRLIHRDSVSNIIASGFHDKLYGMQDDPPEPWLTHEWRKMADLVHLHVDVALGEGHAHEEIAHVKYLLLRRFGGFHHAIGGG